MEKLESIEPNMHEALLAIQAAFRHKHAYGTEVVLVSFNLDNAFIKSTDVYKVTISGKVLIPNGLVRDFWAECLIPLQGPLKMGSWLGIEVVSDLGAIAVVGRAYWQDRESEGFTYRVET